jgi:uncharacterized protein YecE (DUF72 family)
MKIAARAAGIRIGCAGWRISKADAASFPIDGSHLERYAAKFNAVEINSSFYRSHRPATYARWAASVPPVFRFAVKMPRAITHRARLVDAAEPLDVFLSEVAGLGEKLGCLLIQLPPSLRFDRGSVGRFLTALRRRHGGSAVIEPRHATWFGAPVGELLADHGVGRVAADPAVVASAASPGGDRRTLYFRLHGSPKMYCSAYEDAYLQALVQRIGAAEESGGQVWCIFDNTALDAAVPNALRTLHWVGELRRPAADFRPGKALPQ